MTLPDTDDSSLVARFVLGDGAHCEVDESQLRPGLFRFEFVHRRDFRSAGSSVMFDILVPGPDGTFWDWWAQLESEPEILRPAIAWIESTADMEGVPAGVQVVAPEHHHGVLRALLDGFAIGGLLSCFALPDIAQVVGVGREIRSFEITALNEAGLQEKTRELLSTPGNEPSGAILLVSVPSMAFFNSYFAMFDAAWDDLEIVFQVFECPTGQMPSAHIALVI